MRCIALPVLMLLLAACQPTAAPSPPAQEAIPSVGGIRVSVAIEDFPDPTTTHSVVTKDFIAQFEARFVDQLERDSKFSPEDPHFGFSASSMRYSESGEHVVVTEMRPPARLAAVDGIPTVSVLWWVQDGQLKRVFCLDETGAKLDYRGGACGRAVAETFGYESWFREQ